MRNAWTHRSGAFTAPLPQDDTQAPGSSREATMPPQRLVRLAVPAPDRAARRDWSLILAGSASLVVGLVALAWSYRSNLILAYGDSASHLYIARHVLDSRTPGIA